ncbi:TPA: PIN domain nuclease [bacterium]|nr:PIN domain nuclease [bacterium]
MWRMRLFFVFIALFFGYLLGVKIASPLFGILSGVLIGAISVLGELVLRKTDIKNFFILSCGLVIGLIVVNLTTSFIKNPLILLGIFLICGYLGATLIYERHQEILALFKKRQDKKKILDTSAIIDGRIIQIIMSGFLDGEVIVPRFVLDELHATSDSQDTLKRNRGRRGLDILKELQSKVVVHIEKDLIPEVKDVDKKLICLAKKMGASILTCDYNLNKVAQIEGVFVLNINELMEALKPSVFPGEVFYLQIVKEGKEFGQGIGYLDDGTMVVVEDGSDYLGRKVRTEVNTVHQSPSGRIIFTKIAK